MSFELLDIGLHYTNKGVDKVKSLPLYQKVDSQINLLEKFELVKNYGSELFTYLDQKISPVVQSVLFLYD